MTAFTALPSYDEAAGQVQVIQLFQAIMVETAVCSATLADLKILISSLQEQYGAAATLEQVIQSHVAAQLMAQHAARRSSKAQCQEVAS